MFLIIFSLSCFLNYTASLCESRIHITEIMWITFLSLPRLLELGAVVINKNEDDCSFTFEDLSLFGKIDYLVIS